MCRRYCKRRRYKFERTSPPSKERAKTERNRRIPRRSRAGDTADAINAYMRSPRYESCGHEQRAVLRRPLAAASSPPPWSRSGESSRALKERVRARAAKFVRGVLRNHQLAGIYAPVLLEVRYKKRLQFLCRQFMASLESLSMKFGWEGKVGEAGAEVKALCNGYKDCLRIA